MYNRKLIEVVKRLQIKDAVTTLSTELPHNKGSVSSYLSGGLKASEGFLKKFANKYKLDLEDLIDTTASESQDDSQAVSLYKDESVKGEVDNEKLVDYIIKNADQLSEVNMFNIFIEQYRNEGRFEAQENFNKYLDVLRESLKRSTIDVSEEGK